MKAKESDHSHRSFKGKDGKTYATTYIGGDAKNPDSYVTKEVEFEFGWHGINDEIDKVIAKP